MCLPVHTNITNITSPTNLLQIYIYCKYIKTIYKKRFIPNFLYQYWQRIGCEVVLLVLVIFCVSLCRILSRMHFMLCKDINTVRCIRLRFTYNKLQSKANLIRIYLLYIWCLVCYCVVCDMLYIAAVEQFKCS